LPTRHAKGMRHGGGDPAKVDVFRPTRAGPIANRPAGS
jgi:hypothetical protein